MDSRDEVDGRRHNVIEERGSLHLAWQQKKVYLDQLLDLHYFMRDTKQVTRGA
jgi:spectrin beta